MEKPNRLANEKSPYLLEHAFNPVDWYPWSDEGLKKAKNDGKPIFLSVGYSTCHWCHRMREESFEDQKTAAFINKNFIPIKVDREERPEVDAYYMSAVQAMTGGGGWPLSVFLTPELKPFYGGTYFPPEPKYGMPSFIQVLQFVSNLWKEKRAQVVANSDGVLNAISKPEAPAPDGLGTQVLDEGYAGLVSSFDPEHGGFGRAPKFPLPASLSFLLRYNYRTGKELALKSVLKTLDEIMAGGIRDHVGGGFHRYSTDRVWLVPHFEKMLYDAALLTKVYAEAHQLTKKREYADVVNEALGWMGGEMQSPEGGFYSAQDADTSQGEGTYYTWTPDEVEEATGPADGRAFCSLYGVTKTGNFEGRAILHLDPNRRLSPDESRIVERSKTALYESRSRRPRPATDSKVLTSWNGLAISAFSYAGAVLGESKHIDTAAKAADFVLRRSTKDGALLRRYAGGEAAFEGTLEDYAYFVQGLLDLFEAAGDPKWLEEAVRLTKVMVGGYEDREKGGFYLTLGSEPARLKETYDGPTPSGNSVAALNLIRLSELTGDAGFRRTAEKGLKSFGGEVERAPTAHTTSLVALDLLLNGVKEVVISAKTPEGAEEMRSALFGSFVPDAVVLVASSQTYGRLAKVTSLLEGREPSAKPMAYVCRNFVCKIPADSPQALTDQLTSR
jgi:uncharacterized protein